ncbi:MAG: hypothetical protein WCV84_01640 [Patescibacteria group bacterium]
MHKPGFVTLLFVLILSAIGSAIAVSVLLSGVGSTRTSFIVEQSAEARALANLCAEEAIQKLRESSAYTGNETIVAGNGSCFIATVTGSGNANRTVQTVGTVGTIQRKVQVLLSAIRPLVITTSWQEVADF